MIWGWSQRCLLVLGYCWRQCCWFYQWSLLLVPSLVLHWLLGGEAIQWGKVAGIVGSWVVTPAISGFIAYLIFMSAQKLTFDTKTRLKVAKRFVPIYMGLAGFVMALVTIKKGLKHIGIQMGTAEGFALAIVVGGRLRLLVKLPLLA